MVMDREIGENETPEWLGWMSKTMQSRRRPCHLRLRGFTMQPLIRTLPRKAAGFRWLHCQWLLNMRLCGE
jgi:hypothetical protein